jgi:hypothetical protein
MTCAHAVRVAISKFEGVEDVDVSLQRGHARVRLKRGNTVELKKVMAAVGHQALEVRHVSIVASGSAISDSKRGWWFAVAGTGERIALRDPAPPDHERPGSWKVSFAVPKKSKTGEPAVMSNP